MELRQLRYFMESAENENFSQTAKLFFVPPSSVSISVKALEKEIGCELFDRSYNKISLNSNGKILYTTIKPFLESLDFAVDKIKANNKKISGKINILIRSDRRIIFEKITTFRKLMSDVSFFISHDFESNNMQFYDLIVDEKSDKYKSFVSYELFSERLRFATNSENPLAKKKLTLKDLKNENFVSMAKGNSLNRILSQKCSETGFSPCVSIYCDDPYYLRKYVESGFGVTIIPELSWKNELSSKISFLNVTDFKAERTVCVYLNKKSSSLAVKEFLNYLISDSYI